MKEFSQKDLQLLYEIDLNARTPLNKIAKKMKMSQQGIHYKIQQFEEKKVILNYYTLIDYICFGYSCYKVLFSLHHAKKEQKDLFLQTLKQHSSILSITELGAHYDYMVLFAQKNASRCTKEIHTLLTQFPQLIKNYSILTNAVSYEFKRKYLTEHSSRAQSIVLGGDRDIHSMDIMTIKILKELYDNPRISYVKIAAKHEISPKTAIAKIRNLETRGIIKGYGANIDCYSYKYQAYKILLKTSSVSKQKDEELLKFYRQQEEIVHVSKIFGNWDYEIDVEVASLKDFHAFSILLRAHFGEIIQHFDVYPILNNYITSTVPKSFFLDQ